LFTLEVSFGIEIDPFFKHYPNATKAGEDLKVLKRKLFGSNEQIKSVKLWHRDNIISQYHSQPTKYRWVTVAEAPKAPRPIPQPLNVAGRKAKI